MLLQKIKDKTARIGIIGLGYVGLPLVCEFHKTGFSVIGLDIDQIKVDMLNQGKSYINHIPDENIQALTIGGGSKAAQIFLWLKNWTAFLYVFQLLSTKIANQI